MKRHAHIATPYLKSRPTAPFSALMKPIATSRGALETSTGHLRNLFLLLCGTEEDLFEDAFDYFATCSQPKVSLEVVNGEKGLF